MVYMCTVIINVPAPDAAPTRFIAIRDEDPGRPWLAPGEHWPQQYPGVVGIRDQRAGGAWLAFDEVHNRAAVVLNRRDHSGRDPRSLATRGTLALDAVMGIFPEDQPKTAGFNLLTVSPSSATVVSWDGISRHEYQIPAGVHMLAHDDLDDLRTDRIKRWLPDFRAAASDLDAPQAHWWQPWVEVIELSDRTIDPADPQALIRSNVFEGASSKSLLSCAVSVEEGASDLAFAELAEAGRWGGARYC